MKLISVFGSAKPKPNTLDYEQAYQVGKLLAEAGFGVSTGGYSGTMAGVSQGAAEAGGHVVGVTCTVIGNFRGEANEWVAEEIKYESYRDRLLHLVVENAGMIALPGGIGTLGELSLAWGLIQVNDISSRPLVVLGERWQEMLTEFVLPAYVRPADLQLVEFANTPAEAVEKIVTNGR